MDMDMNPASSNSTMVMMVPWLHFNGGDYLYFESWRPVSPGALVGACIGLVLLALLDRWVAATRSVLDAHWRRSGLVLLSQAARHGKSSSLPSAGGSEKSLNQTMSAEEVSGQAVPTPLSIDRITCATPMRTIPPFILAHDLPRGLIHAAQSLLSYLLMLAIMTFNASYLISIVVGLGIGEVIFGRMGNGRSAVH